MSAFFVAFPFFIYVPKARRPEGRWVTVGNQNMRNEMSAFFVAFSVFYIRAKGTAPGRVQPATRVEGGRMHKKTGLANARPAYYEVQPATRVTNRLTKSPHHQITNKLQFLDRSSSSTLLNLLNQSL